MPTALLVSCAMYRYSAARMPAALKTAGFHVHALCPKHSLLHLSECLDGGRLLPQQISSDELFSATATSAAEISADIIIACDEATALALADGARSHKRWQDCRIEDLEQGLRIIRRWFGSSPSWENRRADCIEAVAASGVRTPLQVPVDLSGTCAADLSALGSPIILKLDNSSAGRGVIKIDRPGEAIKRIATLRESCPPMPLGCRIVAQDFIPGRAASVSFSSLNGRILEAFSYFVIHHQPEPFGPASVIEVADDAKLRKMADQVVKLAEYSGFGGIDAILPDDGGSPVFLEFNGRPTQTTHLGRLVGNDLCRAMACAISGQHYMGRHRQRGQTPIALFPSEWIRDRNSRYLTEAHHDVPWSEGRITAAIMMNLPELQRA